MVVEEEVEVAEVAGWAAVRVAALTGQTESTHGIEKGNRESKWRGASEVREEKGDGVGGRGVRGIETPPRGRSPVAAHAVAQCKRCSPHTRTSRNSAYHTMPTENRPSV